MPSPHRTPRFLPALALLLAVACGSAAERQSQSAQALSARLSQQRGEPLRVTGDKRIARGRYVTPPTGVDGRGGALRLEGLEGVRLDLRGVELRGTPKGTDLDRNVGWGIVVRDCTDVEIIGGEIGGYKTCLVVIDSQRVTIDGVHFEGYFGQRLLSTVAAEDPADWLRPHDNDADEWITRYGAAISITGSKQVVVRNCRGRRGQNGILLTRTDESEVYDNDFSFLSGWGLAMYRSSHNFVSHNVFDYCVRGYSHNVYWRGQDSAGILMFERSSDNVVAFNSATHSGHGVFLFGGRDLVDGRARRRGEPDPGGSDRNLFYGNDLRHAVANSLEATFSTGNKVLRNRLSGSHQHGVWGGYSNNMAIVANEIDDTRGGGVTIEHGQECIIAHNDIRRNRMGVELYWDIDRQFVEGPFGEQRDTDSRDHWIVQNRFEDNDQDVVVRHSAGIAFDDNTYRPGVTMPYTQLLSDRDGAETDMDTLRSWTAGRDGSMPSGNLTRTSLRPWIGTVPPLLQEALTLDAPDVPGSKSLSAGEHPELEGGLETILIGEWGPWDFRSGQSRPDARLPGGLLAETRWDAAWFAWDRESHDPRGDRAAWRALAARPIVTRQTVNWYDPWGGEDVRHAVGDDYFGLVATATLTIEEAGRYELTTVSDDGVRVLVDGIGVLENWTWHSRERDVAELELAAGPHQLTLEYFQINGPMALTVELRKLD